MPEIITGFHFDSGSSAQTVDYGQTYAFTRPGGDWLSVAIVADSGQSQSQQNAQIAVNTLISYLQQRAEPLISDLLSSAVLAAHQAVYSNTSLHRPTSPESKGEDQGCSLAVAVIHNGEKLYIANAGNCGIYFVRDGKFSQLSLDHTFKNIAPILGKIDSETAESNPDADKLVRTLGHSKDIDIDVGFHVGQTTGAKAYVLAQSRGKKGLPLQMGDAILVCSDGLFRNHGPSAPALIRQDEIVQILTTQEGDRAARGLVSFALGRDAADNVSVAILQTPDPSRAIRIVNQAKVIRQRTALLFGGLTALILLFYVAAIWMFRDRPDVDLVGQPIRVELADINNNTPAFNGIEAGTATVDSGPDIRATQTVAAILAATEEAIEEARPTETPIPTKTPRPTLQPGQIGVFRLRDQDESTPVYEDVPLFANQIAEAQINHEGIDADDASIYSQQSSEIEFNQVDAKVEFRLFEESDVFIETGLYSDGAIVEVRAEDGDVLFSVAERSEGAGACMGVEFSEEEQTLLAYCYKGDCSFQVGREESVEIQAGRSISFDPIDLSLQPVLGSIPQAITISYQRLLGNFPGGYKDINACLGGFLPVTPTPTSTATIFVPPATDEPEWPTRGATSTPRMATDTPATKTPIVTPTTTSTTVPTIANTKTPTPAATATPVLPTKTATAAVSTNTPIPSKTPTVSLARKTPTPVTAPTKTPTISLPTKTQVPTKTPISKPTETPTVLFPTKTTVPTKTPFPTKTLPPTATPTKVIVATVSPPTKTPLPTNTPLPEKTSTPVIVATLSLPTKTPVVINTPTPVFVATILLPTPTPLIFPTISIATPQPIVIPTIQLP